MAKRCGPAGTALHERFAGLLHRAKRAPPDEDLVRRMEGEVLEIAAGCRALGDGKLATRLENAAPYLFTFVMHPELHHTNNEAERMLRPIAIQRLIRKHHVTEGMRAFSRIMTCALTWRKRGLNAYTGRQLTQKYPPRPEKRSPAGPTERSKNGRPGRHLNGNGKEPPGTSSEERPPHI